MNFKPWVWALAACAAATMAIAQERPKPAPVDQARALAEAQRLIRDAEAEGIFTAGADAGGPTVRHTRSGLVCHFEYDGPANGLTVFDKGPNRGNDIGCNTRVREISVTLYANRVADIGDLAKASAGQVAAIKRRFPDAKPYVGQLAELSAAGAPQIIASRFEVAINDQPTFTRAAAMQLGDWVITERVSAPKPAALAADMLGGMMLMNAAKEAAPK